jgi:chromosome segregation ATPase
MSNLKVTEIRIKNILGLTECTFQLGKFTTVSGSNGTGKTSVFKAVKSVFEGGYDATLIRNGEQAGEVVFVLEDGTNFTKTIDRDKAKSGLKATGQKSPQSYLNSISDITSVNPVSFLTGDDKARLKILLESMPIELPVERLKEITGEELPEGEPLVVLDAVRKSVYDNRTSENRAIKEKKASIASLESTLTPVALAHNTDFQTELDEAEKELAEKTQKRDTYKDEINTLFTENRDTMVKVEANELAELQNQKQAELNAISEKYEKLINETKQKYTEQHVLHSSNKQEKLDKLTESFSSYSVPKLELIAQLKEAVKHEAVSQSTRLNIENQKSELATFEEQAINLNAQLEEIDNIKKEILSKTPFPNVQVQDGIIFVDTVRFNHLNTAQQVAFALKLAVLRAGELRLVCLDNMECLDEGTLKAFKTAAAKYEDIQFIITRVETDKELTIISE